MNSSVNQNLLISRIPFVKLLTITLAYYLTGKLGLSLPFLGSHVTLFWLPTGIAVAALLRYGWGCWPAVYLGAFFVNLAIGSSIALAMGIAIGNTLAPVLTTWLLRRMRVDLAFKRHQDIPLLCLSSAIGMLISAGSGVLMLLLANAILPQAMISVFTSWWMGDFVGVLLATPLLLAMSRNALKTLWLKRSELLVWSVLALVVIWFAFFAKFVGPANLPLAFLPLPLAVWAALRFGLLGATISTLLLSFLAVLGTYFGGGPFHGVSLHLGWLLLWAYMVTLLITNLIVTALLAERNYAEVLLKSSLAQTKLLLDASLDAIVNMNQSGIVTGWNLQAERMFGYSQTQAIGRELAELIVPPALRDAHRNGLARFLNTKNPTLIGKRIEVTGMRANGAEFPIELTLAMLENQGQFTFSAYIRDISERNKTLEALRKSELSAKEALQHLQLQKFALDHHAIVAIADRKGLITYANSKFCEISGYSLQELIGQDHSMLNSGYHPKGFFKEMYRTLTRGESWHKEVCNRAKDGSLYWVDTTISPYISDDGKPQSYISIRTDITQRKLAEDKSNYLALYDPLTELPNRRLLMDRLNQAMVKSARSHQIGALLFIDLDHFKALNDTQGHDVGDMLLQQVAGRLANCIRECDTVARLGGDEFVVLLEDLSENSLGAAVQAEGIAEKIHALLNQPYQLGTYEHHNSPSIGVTLFNAHEFEKDELLKQADIAMYASKKAGRNTLRFFDPEMQESISARVDLEHELRKAIEQQQFQLHYQIQVGSNGQALGAEALIRWQHPERGMISPFHFIPLAEDTGLILPIGQWVLDTACAQLQIWQQNPLTQDLILAVNVSAKQFFQKDFVEQMQMTIQRHDINPAHLKLELTESMLVDNISDIIGKMSTLSKIGIRFSLDDFGTGYSSLQYLKKLPLNQLKIDQSFVRDIVTDSSDRTIVRTIITMAHSLDINVIAEGVETAEQRQYLLDNGCTHYQGYLFSKPVSIDEFEALLGKS